MNKKAIFIHRKRQGRQVKKTQKVDKLSTENAGVFAALTAQSLYKEKLESLALEKLSTKQKK